MSMRGRFLPRRLRASRLGTARSLAVRGCPCPSLALDPVQLASTPFDRLDVDFGEALLDALSVENRDLVDGHVRGRTAFSLDPLCAPSGARTAHREELPFVQETLEQGLELGRRPCRTPEALDWLIVTG
jgi:hypothetical protein